MIGNSTGKLGEDIACKYIVSKGFDVIERNYWKPYGEIDIIAVKDNKLHFVEVKSVLANSSILPEHNVNSFKLKKLGRVVSSFLSKKKYKNLNWVFDICLVSINKDTRMAKVRLLENEIIPE